MWMIYRSTIHFPKPKIKCFISGWV